MRWGCVGLCVRRRASSRSGGAAGKTNAGRGACSRGRSYSESWRQRLDARLLGAGADDDRARAGHVLWRPGPQEERVERGHAVLFLNGPDDRPLGHLWLLTFLWRHESVDRRRHLPVHAQRPSRVDRKRTLHSALFDGHSDADPHALSGHVLHHHPRADLRRLCRTDEVQRHGRVLHSVGHAGLLPDCPLGVGRGHIGVQR